MSMSKNVLAVGVIIFALCNLFFVYIAFNAINNQKQEYDRREQAENIDLSKEYLKLAVKGTFLMFSVFCSAFLLIGAVIFNRFSLTAGFILLFCEIIFMLYKTITKYVTALECQDYNCPKKPDIKSTLILSKLKRLMINEVSTRNDDFYCSAYDRGCF